MIRGVLFTLDSGEKYHSWRDFALIRSSKQVGKAAVKASTIDIPGADGVLDFTDYFGEPKFKNRQITIEFSCKEKMHLWDSIYSNLQNILNGQHLKLTFEEDDEFYYVGRCSINEWRSSKKIGKIVVEIDAEPYKYKIQPTVISNAIVGSDKVVLNNLRKRVVPTITTTADINIIFESSSFSLSPGTYVVPDIVLKAGTNEMTITGTADVTITYQEGCL